MLDHRHIDSLLLHIVDELEGDCGTVFRTSPTRAASEGFAVDSARVRQALSALRQTDDEALLLRRQELLGLLPEDSSG